VSDAPPCGTPAALPGADRLWRSSKDHKSWHEWDDDSQAWIPGGHTLDFDESWSSRWAEHLELSHDMGAASAMNAGHGLVYEVAVDRVRGLGMPVAHDPEGPTPLDCAHVATDYGAHGNPTRPQRRRLRLDLARRLVLVHGTVTLPPPDGA
jgi:hypothetical protein